MLKQTELDPSHLKDIYQLVKVSGLADFISEEKWMALRKWTLFDEPFRPKGAIAGHFYTNNGTLVAYLSYSYRLVKLGDEISTGVSVVEYVVHPEHRGLTGILACKQTFDFFKGQVLLGQHSSEGATKVWSRLGAWEVAGSNLTYRGVFSPVRSGLARGVKWPWAVKFLNHLGLSRFSPQQDIECDYELSDADETTIDGVCEKFASTYDIGVYRNYAYLKWRYQNHPFTCYQFFKIIQRGDWVGLGVVKIDRSKAQIHELIYNPQLKGIEELSLQAALQFCKRKSAVEVESKIMNPGIQGVFEKMSFEVSEKAQNQFIVVSNVKGFSKAIYTFGDFKEY